jgi:serpin B
VGKAFYALEAYKVDFSNHVEAARRINAWSKQKTQGFVRQVVQPNEIDPDTILAIANALYLQALWQQPFKIADYEMDFFVEAGKSVSFRPMERELDEVPYVRTEACEIVGLPYRGGNWLCYVVLPRRGLSVEELVSGLDAARWQEWLGQMKPQKVQVVMPRFEVQREYDLIPALRRMGIQRAFGAAEFPRISERECGLHLLIQAGKSGAGGRAWDGGGCCYNCNDA